MRATTIMLLAFGALIATHWAANEPTVSAKLVVEMVFAILFIAMLDQGKTEPIAKGFAWLFLAAVLLSKKSILLALGKAGTTPKPAGNTGATVNNAKVGINNVGSAPTPTGA